MLHVLLNQSNCLNVLLNCTELCCSIAVNGRMNNIDKAINEVIGTIKHTDAVVEAVVIFNTRRDSTYER